jgi:D-alanine-D-alanine ligase
VGHLTDASTVRVVVLMGGPSGEREISLRSGAAVLAAMDPERFSATALEISAEGAWRLPDSETETDDPGTALALDGPSPVQVAVIAMHGAFGEDGTVQGMLEAAGVPYTGSGVLASALAMDKERSKVVVSAAGLRVPAGATVAAADWRQDPEPILESLLDSPGVPAFVKPVHGGSSLAAGPAADEVGLRARIDEAVSAGTSRILVEERLLGREVTCAVLGNRGEPLRTLPVVEILPRSGDWFDFEAKYDEDACDEICPAEIDEETARQVKEAARVAHEAIGCDGMSRSDFILVNGRPCYLETNTIPGLTEASLCPKAAAAEGMSMQDLVTEMVDMALERHDQSVNMGKVQETTESGE